MTPNSPVDRHHVVRAARRAPAAAPAARVPAPDPEADRVTRTVERLRAQWTRCGADIAAHLRPGVDEARLDAVERQLGLLMPRGARAWWRAVDGVDPVRTAYRTSAPTVGPGGWVPLTLDEAVRRASGRGPGLAAPPALLPLFARDEELIAVRLGSSRTVVELVVVSEDGEGYQHSWRVGLDELLGTWADAMLAAVHWLPDAHDWVTDPFALQALPRAELLD
ncbi:hypothetical protein FHR75_003606 [Kineococcus radiotolerans]|uniref:Knr4/Smi1-like domain-containing protein n=2 Tax=Kineococcus radiotolerans TaxID=131568 RepID=A6WCL7_KINRD|nr:hypothetical protein [Kineococcus radiotolerans]ABS04556.1 hypothetical protein Krad_3092 [Kineococcus radiotolerans SRS30216 = ATCC BAA-149]MBB2902770.1 hypothetical protein [Kineococcus radiotolerans]